MKTNLLKTLSIVVIAFAMMSCNLGPDSGDTKEALGFVLEVKSETSYTVKTDTLGIILDANSKSKLLKSDEGKRVYVKYKEHAPAGGGLAAQVSILYIGKTQYNELDYKSLVDAMPKDKQDSVRGRSAVIHERLWIVNGLMNIQYAANSNGEKPGYSSLEYDEAASDDKVKVFKWYYTAVEDAPLVPMYSTFNLGDLFGAERVTVRIVYKDMVSQSEKTLAFYHNASGN